MLIRYSRHLIVWAVALALAVLTAVSALGAIAKHRSPPFILNLWPANGAAFEAIAEAATRRIVSASSSQDFTPDSALIEVARAALTVEPTSVAALRILAQYQDGQNRRERAQRLMRLAAAVTKRDTLVNMWLIDDYGRADDVDATLTIYDQTLRTLGDGRGPVVTVMASALSNPRLIGPYFRLLRQNPPWADSFWHVVAQTPQALDNAARLRMLMARAHVPVSQQKDEMLLGALVEQRKFETGFRLYEAIRPARGRDAGPVNNGDFSHASAFQPFDWRLTSSGEMGAAIDPRAGRLEISAISGFGARAAEQIVRLPPGRYTLRADYSRQPPGAASPGHIELACAEADTSVRPIRVDLARSPASHAIDLSSAACHYYWLRIGISVDEAQQNLDLSFDRLQLIRN